MTPILMQQFICLATMQDILHNPGPMKAMRKIRIPLQLVLKVFCLLGAFVVLPACGGGQKPHSPSAQPSPPGMHVYKDPVTGKFVSPPPPPSDTSTSRVLPQALQQIKRPGGATRPAQEYKSPAKGGGILLDLPAPYSDRQK